MSRNRIPVVRDNPVFEPNLLTNNGELYNSHNAYSAQHLEGSS